MDRALNPFNPGAGLRPQHLVGRSEQIADFDALVTRVERKMPNRGLVLSGLRGVGKTVLLNELRHHAESAGWFVVSLEAQPSAQPSSDIRERLARELLTAARQLSFDSRDKLDAPNKPSLAKRIATALRTITSFSAKVGITGIDLGVTLATGRGDSGDLEVDLTEVIEDVTAALAPEGLAFALFIDEMQDMDSLTLSTLIAAQHDAGQRGRPFYIIGAGLPNLPLILSQARSYAERLFQYYTIGPLTPDEARAALTQPARDMGAEFTEQALDILLENTAGYPYFLQEFGKAIWDVALVSPFTIADAELAILRGHAQLDSGFFLARWDRASAAERELMRAMVPDGESSSAAIEVAARLGKERSSIGPARASLISKGILFSPDIGQLAFTVPGMAAFIARQDEA